MSKEIEIIICTSCESNYRLVYDLTETSGFGKFCPFCSSEVNEEDYPEEDLEE